jgi:hypothetical protein
LGEGSDEEGGDYDRYVRGLVEEPLQERFQSNDATYIHGDQCARQQAIDQGLVDEHIHIPQAIAQDREAEGEWNEEDKASDLSPRCC